MSSFVSLSEGAGTGKVYAGRLIPGWAMIGR